MSLHTPLPWLSDSRPTSRSPQRPRTPPSRRLTSPASTRTCRGLIAFAQGVLPGSARVIASVGDERTALLMLTVQTAGGPDGAQITLPGAWLYLLDENGKIKVEQVVFYVVPN
jgi:hypothetical protein